MSRKTRLAARFSLQAQGFGHRTFVAFFLASIVPLMFIVFVANEYVFPRMLSASEDIPVASISTAIVLITLLSLLAFAVLEQTTKQTLREIRGHGERLKTLLEVSRALNAATNSDMLFGQVAESAARLVSAQACYVFVPDPGLAESLKVAVLWGDEAAELLEQARAPLEAAARAVVKDDQTILGVEDPGGVVGSVLSTPLSIADQASGALVLVRRGPCRPFDAVDQDAAASLCQQAGVALHNVSLKEAQANFFTHVTQILVHALDTHVEHQQGHVKRVAFYSNQIGRELCLSEAQLERLYFAALLHDVGMLKLAEGSGSDMDRLRKHALLGFEMISPITLWSDVAPMILHHQEWHNGDGFPEGLSGEQIPLESRVIALADALDTMTAESSHRARIDLPAALDELGRRAGTQFDPELVSALTQICERGDIKL